MAKLNLGSKHRKLTGFDNLDKIFGWKFQDGLLQYENDSVEGITISHALMFLTIDEIKTFMKEVYRVLKPGGIIRITEDDAENPKSAWYKTGNIKSGPASLTGPKMMRQVLEAAELNVYDVNRNTTHFFDKSLMQSYRGGAPNVFFIEGIKGNAILSGIKNHGRPYEIPDASRDDLPQFFADLGFKTGAEIGVYRGDFTEKFCDVGLFMYAVDPWIGYRGAGKSELSQLTQDKNFIFAQKRLSAFENCQIIKNTSMEAVKKFKTRSLDFVYIDGDHRFKYIAEDISEWYYKVRPGGIVSGHDYFYTNPKENNVVCNVAPVVDAFVKAFDIKTFRTFGKKDKTLSWMFIKP